MIDRLVHHAEIYRAKGLADGSRISDREWPLQVAAPTVDQDA